MLFIAEHL